MPAERSRGSRRSGADGNQLVWTMPVEPASPSGISFATNLTPITFNELDSGSVMTGDTQESELFPFANDPSSPRRPAHSKKKAENHIPRPPNAFILFRSSFIKSQHVSTEVETNHSTLSKIIGLTWQNLPEDERQVWHSKAKAALDDHRRKFPQYAFRPLHSKAKGGTEKRKVREVGQKDMKRCAKIAELLVEGKKGQELDAAIQEFDKYHVPEMVTRFEAPITERTFQRSTTTAVKIEDSDAIDTTPARPSRSTTRSPQMRSSSADRSTTYAQSRSESPGPPPLVDRDQAERYLLSQLSSTGIPPRSPQTSDSSFNFPSVGDSLLPPHMFSLNAIPNSFVPVTSTNTSSIPVDLLPSTFDMFDRASSNTAEGRPSLSIDTSYLNAPILPSMDTWTTRSSSPVSVANMSIPSTPYYPASPMSSSYDPAFNSYTPIHGLRHSSSSYSLESTSSFESTASYDDISAAYSNEYYSSTPSDNYLRYAHPMENPMVFVAGNDSTDFSSDDYCHPLSETVSCSAGIDEIEFEKNQAQYHYSQTFNIGYPFFPPPLSLGQ
ncbi:hypothetical protein DFH05DRAFT_399797 [Lentinula detonsa]|uniref:HMG box domain-containing protein n=1 Tax=Lentinula detonsa TaxID=2804962 RepID=A0A9W8TUF4_9AGAR|nr:hypothetical protein DFH05DRAFT_399797 [Lentinula detonsa]